MRILRLLSGRPLACGCLAGIYETYTGPTLWIVDARGADCADPAHRPGVQLVPAGRTDGVQVGTHCGLTGRAKPAQDLA